MSAHGERMSRNLIEEPEDDCGGPELPYSVFPNSGNQGRRFCQQPFKVATGCLTAVCMILLLILLVTRLHTGKAPPSGQDSTSSAPETHMQKGCGDVTALTADLQDMKKQKSDLEKERVQLTSDLQDAKKQKSDLEKERVQLMDRIAKLEAKSAPQTTAVPTKSPCPEDWKYFSNSCYFISTFSRSWSDSQTFCKRKGGHLAIIHTAEEQTFIWDLLPRGHWNAYWFGISDESVEEDWQWVDGTKLVGGFWEDGEPNNHINEDCGYMIKTDVLTRVATKSWYDAPCYASWPFICEKAASS